MINFQKIRVASMLRHHQGMDWTKQPGDWEFLAQVRMGPPDDGSRSKLLFSHREIERPACKTKPCGPLNLTVPKY
jgi:hypothetical protein